MTRKQEGYRSWLMKVMLSGKNTLLDRTFLLWKSNQVTVKRIDPETADKDAKQFKTLHHIPVDNLPGIPDLIDTALNLGVYVEILTKYIDETDPWAHLTPGEKTECVMVQFADNKEVNTTVVIACFKNTLDLEKCKDLITE